MNIFRPYLCIILFFGCSKQPSELDLLNKEYPQGNYGNRIQKGIPNRVHEVLKNPDEYLNKNVLVSGIIDDVCPMRGCWIQISDKNQAGPIRNRWFYRGHGWTHRTFTKPLGGGWLGTGFLVGKKRKDEHLQEPRFSKGDNT